MPLLRKLGVSTMEGDIGMIGTNIDAQENLPELERVPPGSMIDPVASFNDGPVDIKGLMKTIKNNPANALGSHLKGALVKMSHRRALFVMCSGMHTTAAQDILKKVCSGKLRGPGL